MEETSFETWRKVMATNLDGVFLCSAKASYITGQVLAADGGFESTGVGLPSLRS